MCKGSLSAAVAVALLFSGCMSVEMAPHEAVNEEPPFDLANFEDTTLDIMIQDEAGAPVPRVYVQLSRVDGSRAEVLWRTYSAADGTVHAELPVVSAAERFELLMQRNGYSGPYTTEERRERAGRLAASSVLELTRDDLAEVNVTFRHQRAMASR